MKKKLLALLLVFAMLLSCMLVLASCGDDEPENPSGPSDPSTPDTPADNDPNLNLKEDLPDGNGGAGIDVVTDPTNPEAGKGTEDEYIHGNN